MTKWTIPDTPSPEAIVRAALERAASEIVAMRGPTDVPRTEKAVVFDDACDRCLWILMDLASNPAEVAAIISAAGQLNKEQSDEEDQG